MWPENQPPGGEQNPQDQSPNPYQQPGYQQPNPYQQPGYQQSTGGYQQPHSGAYSQPEQSQWAAPTPPPMPQQQTGGGPGGGGQGGGNKTKVTAIVAALAVVVAAGVTGFLVFGGDDDKNDEAGPAKPAKSAKNDASPSPSDDGNARDADDEKPMVDGWQVVVNPKWGTAFDVPPDWKVQTPDTFIAFDDRKEEGAKTIIGMSAPAILKDKWCTSDEDKDGEPNDTSLAAVGTKGQNGAKSTKEVARNDSAWWVYGGYTEQTKADKKKIKIGEIKDFTTKAGIKGSVATSTTTGAATSAKCDSEGKATTFAFKNGAGEFVAWTLYGAKGVKEEVSDDLVQQILGTVRLSEETPEESGR